MGMSFAEIRVNDGVVFHLQNDVLVTGVTLFLCMPAIGGTISMFHIEISAYFRAPAQSTDHSCHECFPFLEHKASVQT